MSTVGRTEPLEIRGRYGTAICYARIIEDEAIAQIRRMCDYPFTRGSRIRVMPDVHAGKACTIGTTMTVTDRAVPNVVGVDIGCGMYTVRVNERDIDFSKLDAAAHRIPSGRSTWDTPAETFDLEALRCFPALKELDWLRRSLGTLGGGNHFIEVDRAGDGTHYLVIHSGSRNLGKQVAEHYQRVAVQEDEGTADIQERIDAMIAEYRATGREREIQGQIRALAAEKKARELPDDLCTVTGQHLADYLADVEVCQAFARRNRELMARILLEDAGLTAGEAFHTIHNYIDTREMILRKGAIAAHAGEKVLIPINMRDGSVLAVGRGNPEWNCSAPHGAGRLMSRAAAKAKLSMEEYRSSMAGVYTTSVLPDTLDESPMAYKSLADIIDVIRDTVDILDVMKPVYNFKASE